MLAASLQDYLKQQKITYQTIPHPVRYTSQEIAAVARVAGKDFAKTVIVKLDGKPVMVVMPASMRLDLAALKRSAQAKSAELAHESEFQKIFYDCETGAMPPFGNIYGLDVWVAQTLTQDAQIAFNAGSHTELIRMAYKDYAQHVHPKVF
jgi:Ala-tRNA(Pro) deacylase